MLERRSLPGGITALVDADLEADGVLVAFTERTGGASEGSLASLNLSLTRGDARGRVVANRSAVARALGIERFAIAAQVHGTNVARVNHASAGAGFVDQEGAVAAADAMVTADPGVAVAVLVADCVPIALASPAEGRVAVVHAGWRGLAAGVLTATLRCFDRVSGLRAVIGPSVGPDHYEVGEDVAAAIDRSAPSGAVIHVGHHRPRVDLGATVERSLRAWGVARVERATECTACHPARYFSHRRDGASGRQALVAVRLAASPGP